jgi:hypothetical protein
MPTRHRRLTAQQRAQALAVRDAPPLGGLRTLWDAIQGQAEDPLARERLRRELARLDPRYQDRTFYKTELAAMRRGLEDAGTAAAFERQTRPVEQRRSLKAIGAELLKTLGLVSTCEHCGKRLLRRQRKPKRGQRVWCRRKACIRARNVAYQQARRARQK